jgi:hypothetical protein
MELHEQFVGSIAEVRILHRFATHGPRVSALAPLRENAGDSARDPNPEPPIGPRTGRSNLQKSTLQPAPEYQNSNEYP